METGRTIEKPLREAVEQLFNEAITATAPQPELAAFHDVLIQCRDRLHQPMRVAIVGLIKAGKSTLMNALLGETVVATGSVEATFNINWLQYGESAQLRVHFKDRRPPQEKSLRELAALTLRADENRDYLLNVKYIEVFYPNPILKTFHLIDTPGLKSVYQDDSQNTIEFLQLYGQNLDAITHQEATHADAVLYLFSQSLGTEDAAIVEQFQGGLLGHSTPINAIGVLTKVDAYRSDPNVQDPMATAQTIARRLAQHPKVRSLFYTIYPVCNLLALGAKTLSSEEFQILTELAKIPSDRFERLLSNVNRFSERAYDDVPVSIADRQKVLTRLGQYGVGLAHALISNGISNLAQLRDSLLQHTGINELTHLVTAHFGHRSFLIKLDTSLRQLAIAQFAIAPSLSPSTRTLLNTICGKFEAIQSQEHAFQELVVLREHYEGKLTFSDAEVEQLLAVTGEYGNSCGERLGLGERATIAEMLPIAEARAAYWHDRSSDELNSDRPTLAAAKILARSFERILYRVRQAKRFLYL